MKPPETFPLTRLVPVDRLPPEGTDVTLEATPQECSALAQDFKLPAIHALVGTFHLSGATQRVHVTGSVKGRVTQICVVTLEPFEAEVDEEVDVDFSEAGAVPRRDAQDEPDLDLPDQVINGQVDLGALAAEFLALGLDPYPRKPGVDFDFKGEKDDSDTPFAALGRLKPSP